jgi:hypothetical protein
VKADVRPAAFILFDRTTGLAKRASRRVAFTVEMAKYSDADSVALQFVLLGICSK